MPVCITVGLLLGLPEWLSGKNLPAMKETGVRSLDQEDPLEKEMTTCCSILVWEILQTAELGGIQSTGSQRAGHDLVTEQ